MANVTGITQYLKMKCTAVATRNKYRAEAEVRTPTGSLPDRLINPEENELSFHTPHATVEPAEGANEAQRRLIPAYTYSVIN